MKTLDDLIAGLVALRELHGGQVRVAVGDEGDGLLRAAGDPEFQADANIDYEQDDAGEYIQAPTVCILADNTVLSYHRTYKPPRR